MKKLGLITLIVIAAAILGSCNKQVFDLTYAYDYAYIELPTGDVIEGNVDSWTDYEDGDQLQITINGDTYLVHSSDCVLVNHGG